MKFIILIIGSSLALTQLQSQTHHLIETNESTGPNRDISILHNLSLGNQSFAGLRLFSGTGQQQGFGGFTQTNLNYTAIPDWKGYLSIWSGSSTDATGNGINLVAAEGDGKIRFYTLGAQPSNLRMILLSNGNVGIGNSNPQEKLQIQDGDIYLSDITGGIIMRSPDGTCYRMTVQNGGAPLFTALLNCP